MGGVWNLCSWPFWLKSEISFSSRPPYIIIFYYLLITTDKSYYYNQPRRCCYLFSLLGPSQHCAQVLRVCRATAATMGCQPTLAIRGRELDPAARLQ